MELLVVLVIVALAAVVVGRRIVRTLRPTAKWADGRGTMCEGCSATGCGARQGMSGHRWMQIAVWLVAMTMAYNAIEAVIALLSGVDAGSIALVGFGLDSIIELAAAAVLFWRLRVEARGADHETIESTERRVHRFVGGTFLALAAYVTAQSGWTLWTADAPQESVVGIILAAASLVIMPLVSLGKLRAAREVGSAALRAEAKETLACSYLSFTLLLGLVANASLGLWWADPAVALLMVPWLIKEGREGLSGEDGCQP